MDSDSPKRDMATKILAEVAPYSHSRRLRVLAEPMPPGASEDARLVAALMVATAHAPHHGLDALEYGEAVALMELRSAWLLDFLRPETPLSERLRIVLLSAERAAPETIWDVRDAMVPMLTDDVERGSEGRRARLHILQGYIQAGLYGHIEHGFKFNLDHLWTHLPDWVRMEELMGARRAVR